MVKHKGTPSKSRGSTSTYLKRTTPSKNVSLAKSSTSTPSISSRKLKTPKKRRAQTIHMFQGTKKFKVLKTTLKEIKRLQSTVTHLIPRLPFSRLIREIVLEWAHPETRIQSEALRALQEAAEIYLTYLFEDANRLAAHAHRVTLKPNDIKLVLEIRGSGDPGTS